MAASSRPPSTLRRAWRRLRYRNPRVELVYSSHYSQPFPEVLNDPRRGERILAWLAAEGLLRAGSVRHPRAASIRSLRRVHTDEYLESLRSPASLTRLLGTVVDEATQDRLLDVQRHMVGGTVLATRLAQTTGRGVFHLGGGLHHAFADHGERLCVFHDVAVAITGERSRGFDDPILVVDLDLHDGDGTRALFADDPGVHTYSIHNETNTLPGRNREETEAVEATTIELGSDVGDDEYLETIRRTLPPLVERFRPALVYYLAGTDPAEDDRLGDWNITAAGLLARDRLVIETLADAPANGGDPPPWVVLLAGGYGRDAWRYSARFVSWSLTGDEPSLPPTADERMLARYRDVALALGPGRLTQDRDDDWNLTEEDLLGGLVGPPRPTRFLDYYSLHGIELALETAGALDRLRALGYANPTFELDLDNPGGGTLRLFGDTDRSELLMELRARRDRRTLAGMEMLQIEWLLLQNPRGRFTEDKPPLPGQRYPGLGMLRDVMSFLVLACERLGLDGIIFVPSRYHLAAQSRPQLRFLDPEHEARYRELRHALEPLRLPEGARALRDGRVVDAAGAPVEWAPAAMVLAVSDRLRQRVSGEDYEARVAATRRELGYRLSPPEAAPPDGPG